MSVSGKLPGSSSTLTETDVTELFNLANISPTDFQFLLPKKSDRAIHPPQGYISVYKPQIQNGLRFPLHHLVESICNRFEISPSQLLPLAHSSIVGFILWAKLYHTPVTVHNFLSLFLLTQVPALLSGEGRSFFSFIPMDSKKNFLERNKSEESNWRGEFFFLRPVGKSWNCITEWSDDCCGTVYMGFKANVFRPGILKCRFRVSELLQKDVLVHGGIEPGVASPQFTFRYLMNRAAVTKFRLQPEDIPHANVTNKDPVTAAAGGMLNTLADSTAALTLSEVPKDVPPENAVSHQELFREGKDNCAEVPSSAHKKTNSAVLVLDEAQPQPPSDPLLAISKTLESMFVLKESYEKLEKEKEEVASELALTKSRVQELEQKIELYKVKRAESDYKTTHAMVKVKVLEKRLENAKSDSDCLRDKIKKEVMEEFKSSDDFANAVHEEAVKYYINGFEACKLRVLNSRELPSGFNFDLLDVVDSEWGSSESSPMPVDDLDKKSLKRKKT